VLHHQNGRGKSLGKLGITCIKARGPPVELPITITGNLWEERGALFTGTVSLFCATTFGFTTGEYGFNFDVAARFTFSIRVSPISSFPVGRSRDGLRKSQLRPVPGL